MNKEKRSLRSITPEELDQMAVECPQNGYYKGFKIVRIYRMAYELCMHLRDSTTNKKLNRDGSVEEIIWLYEHGFDLKDRR
jgi:hypothetical protein